MIVFIQSSITDSSSTTIQSLQLFFNSWVTNKNLILKILNVFFISYNMFSFLSQHKQKQKRNTTYYLRYSEKEPKKICALLADFVLFFCFFSVSFILFYILFCCCLLVFVLEFNFIFYLIFTRKKEQSRVKIKIKNSIKCSCFIVFMGEK